MNIALLTIFFVLSLSGCKREEEIAPFVTAYTTEEHLERLKKRTEEKYYNYSSTNYVVDYNVEIVYSLYTEEPEYFLVECEWAYEYDVKHEMEIYHTKYTHLIGHIVNDKYVVHTPYSEWGRSAYYLSGNGEQKKFYAAYCQAVEKNGEIIQIYNGTQVSPVAPDREDDIFCFLQLKEWDIPQKVISIEQQKHNWKESKTNKTYWKFLQNY